MPPLLQFRSSLRSNQVKLVRCDVFSAEYRYAIRVADDGNVTLTNVTVTDTGFILSGVIEFLTPGALNESEVLAATAAVSQR